MLANLARLDAIGSVYAGHQVVPETPEILPEDMRPTKPIEQWGTLLVYEQIRQGGFGKVFLAYDPDLKKDVALKFERVESGGKRGDDTFIREAQKLAKVRHENVLTVTRVPAQRKTGIWTDLIHGFTLEELLSQQGVFGAQEAAHIGGVEICQALAAVHRAGHLSHNDVKTQNVMRETGGNRPHGFGAATRAPSAGETGTGPPAGTPPYMAPEALQEKRATCPPMCTPWASFSFAW